MNNCACQVHLDMDKSRTYALKKMKKQFIVNTKQQQHVMQEKRLLLTVRCPFIVRSAYIVRTIGKLQSVS